MIDNTYYLYNDSFDDIPNLSFNDKLTIKWLKF